MSEAADPSYQLEDLTDSEQVLLDPNRDEFAQWAVNARAELARLADPGAWPVDPIVWKHMQSLLEAQVAIVDALERAHAESSWLILEKNRHLVRAVNVGTVTTAVDAVESVAKVLQGELTDLAITTNLR